MPVEMQRQVPLAPYTTLGIGGPAHWFATAKTESDVAEAHRFAVEHHLPVFVLGGGSNVLIADRGFAGLVLHMAISGIHREGPALVQAGAGESWDGLVQYTVDRDLAGMECLAGIPGSVGGTPVQNVGAYGQEVSETILSVRAWDTQAAGFVDLSNEACGFGYRTSLLNSAARGRYILTRVDFTLVPGGKPSLRYADLQRRFAGAATPSLTQTAEAVREIRRGKGMVIEAENPNSRSAGSFFRNPVVPVSALPSIAASAAVTEGDVPHWPAGGSTIKLPAAWLLERAGFTRGYTKGRAGISTRHTLALVNRGNASAAEIAALRDLIQETVRARFGVELEQEPVNVG